MVFIRRSRKERAAAVHLRHDTAGRPDVDAGIVGSASQQDIGGSIPERDDFVGKGVDGDAKGSSQTKVRELELAFILDEKVLGLQISVQDAILVTESNALQELIHEGFDGRVVELAVVSSRIHILLQVLVHILKHQHELVLRVDDIVERNNVLVLELFHQRDLADRRRRCALLGVEVDLLEGDELTRLTVPTLEDLGVDC